MLTMTLQLDIPQLNALVASLDALTGRLNTLAASGDKLMDILDPVLAKIASTMQTLADEVVQIREKLANSTTPEQVQAVLDNLDTLESQIREVIPDEPPVEETPEDAGSPT